MTRQITTHCWCDWQIGIGCLLRETAPLSIRLGSSCFRNPHQDGWRLPTDYRGVQWNFQSTEESYTTWFADTPQPLDEAVKLWAKYTRFHILVIGRANAGKKMLLKRMCNTTEEPSIYDEDKNLVSYWLVVISALIISSPTAQTNLKDAGLVILAPTLD